MKKDIFLLIVGLSIVISSLIAILVFSKQEENARDTYKSSQDYILELDRLSEKANIEQSLQESEIEDNHYTGSLNTFSDSDNTSIGEVKLSASDYGLDFDVDSYIIIGDTNICYPLVQTTDNKYYLNHLPNGDYSQGGSIFINYQNENPFKDFNTIIYGHNMKNGTMFGELKKYWNTEDFAKEHDTLIINWKGIRHTYKLFSVKKVHYTDEVFNINPEDKDIWINRVYKSSLVDLDLRYNVYKNILNFVTLSTCGSNSEEKVVTVWVEIK